MVGSAIVDALLGRDPAAEALALGIARPGTGQAVVGLAANRSRGLPKDLAIVLAVVVRQALGGRAGVGVYRQQRVAVGDGRALLVGGVGVTSSDPGSSPTRFAQGRSKLFFQTASVLATCNPSHLMEP